METTVKVDQAMLMEFGMSITQFQEAVAYALGRMTHPETGEPIYINSPVVIISVGSPKATTIVRPLVAKAATPANYSVEE